MSDYETNNPRGWCGDPSRGAALGRRSYHADDKVAPIKLRMSRVYLDNGGYDQLGTYFGTGTPLYWVSDDSGDVDFVLRAASREAAKEQVRRDYPNARFYR